MTGERWEALVHRLDDVAARKPRAYRFRVALLAALGYGYVLLVIAILLGGVATVAFAGLAATLLVLKLAWPLLVLVVVVIRAMWFRIPPPEDGHELTRADAPDLWALVDRVRDELDGPTVHHLLLDDRLNAAVVQVPRYGPAGPQRNYLIVGLPMMQALSEDQFTAVLAHEFGHLSGNHSRFGGWIYRLRRSHGQILDALEERRSRGIWLFRRFFEWYAPYFNAYSFALARQDEYVADRASAEVAGVDASASALVRARLTGEWMAERYWPALQERVEREPEAPRTAYSALRERLPLRPEEDLASQVQRALDEPTDAADTHPALADRLAGLGIEPDRAERLAREVPERSAAAALLDGQEPGLVERFDREWWEDVDPAWREHHAEVVEARRRYDELRDSAPTEFDDRLSLAVLTHRHEGARAAVPMFRDLAGERPDDPSAAFWLGRSLVETGDEAGLEHLDRAMELDPDAILAACESAIDFLLAHDRGDEAERYLTRGRARDAELDAAATERDEVSEDDQFDHHGLPEDVVARVAQTVASEPAVATGYLVRRVLDHLDDEWPAYLVAVRLARGADDDAGAVAQRLADRVEIAGHVSVITLGGEYKPLRRKLKKVPQAELARA